jgi:hypothetical protein
LLLFAFLRIYTLTAENTIQVVKVQAASLITNIIVACLTILAIKSSLFQRELDIFAQEGVIMSIILFVTCSTMCFSSNFWLLTKVLGGDPKEVWGERAFSDSGTILVLLGFITSAHLLLQIRWHVLVLLEVVPPALLAILFAVFGSPEADFYSNLFMLCSILLVSSFGKRTAEMHERELFLAINVEKILRFEAEFRLSQNLDSEPRRRTAESRRQLEDASHASELVRSLTHSTRQGLPLERAHSVQYVSSGPRNIGL